MNIIKFVEEFPDEDLEGGAAARSRAGAGAEFADSNLCKCVDA